MYKLLAEILIFAILISVKLAYLIFKKVVSLIWWVLKILAKGLIGIGRMVALAVKAIKEHPRHVFYVNCKVGR